MLYSQFKITWTKREMPDPKPPDALPEHEIEIIAFEVLFRPYPNQNCAVRVKGYLSHQWYT